jgi:hypothetical protein
MDGRQQGCYQNNISDIHNDTSVNSTSLLSTSLPFAAQLAYPTGLSAELPAGGGDW